MMVGVVLPPDPLVWDWESRPKARKLAIWVNVDLASLPGLLVSWVVPGFRLMLVTFLVPMLLAGLTCWYLVSFYLLSWYLALAYWF